MGQVIPIILLSSHIIMNTRQSQYCYLIDTGHNIADDLVFPDMIALNFTWFYLHLGGEAKKGGGGEQ